jgi:hypothetical protein
MSDEWINNYNEIKEFIASHPDIQIEPIMVSIPENVRPEFYRLFDAVRTGYVKSRFPLMFAEASELGTEFARVQQETTSLLNLKRIDLEPGIRAFLENPGTGLGAGLFDPLFDLLKGKADAAHFDSVSAGSVKNTFKMYFHHGYEYWAALSLICLLEPDKAYTVPVHDQSIDPELSSAESRPGFFEDVPYIETAGTISLDISRVTPFLPPAVILQSEKHRIFNAVSVDVHEVFRGSRVLSGELEWLNKEELRNRFGRHNLLPDMALFTGKDPVDLRVVSDYQNIARPDILLDIMESQDWYEAGKLNIVKLQNKALKPKLGSFVICRGTVIDTAREEIRSDFEEEQELIARQTEAGTPPDKIHKASQPIYMLDVGYDRSKLEPVVSALVQPRKKS